MSSVKRAGRIVTITKILTDNPAKIFPFSIFCEKFSAAKSTISEDVQIIKESFEDSRLGYIKTISGAAGGLCFLPYQSKEETDIFLEKLIKKLSKPDRILSGGYIYTSDILFDPYITKVLGEIIFSRVDKKYFPDYILTVETKGIPLALMTARAFGVPLVAARRDGKVTEGSFVSINYLSGSNGRIQTMSLPKRALPQNSNVIIIDDFMKAGGTAKGITDLVREVGSNVIATYVLMATKEPETKMMKDYGALLSLVKLDETQKITKLELF